MSLFLNHINFVLAKLREQPVSALPTDQTTEGWRAMDAVRQAVNHIWNYKQWSFKIQSHTLATVSGTLQYSLPPVVGEIFSVITTTPPYALSILPESQFDKYVPNPTETGVPQWLRLFGSSSIIAQPSSAGVVQVSSSSASDVAQIVLVKGLIGGNYVDYEELTLAGTSIVSGTKTFSSILSVTKSDVTVGLVSITVGADTVGQIWPQERVHRAQILRLYPTPDSAYSITIKNFGTAPALTRAYEDIEIPARWDHIVNQWGYALALQSKGQEQNTEFTNQLNLAVKFLETDMATEEFIASEEIITPSRWGYITGGDGSWGMLPSGYGYIV